MNRPLVYAATFVVAFAVGLGLTVFTQDVQAKPNDCVLTIEPFLYCEDHPKCKGPGEQMCWECHGWDMYGEPCICTKLGCMVP